MMDKRITLISEIPTVNAAGDTVMEETRRRVWAEMKSVGASYKLQAQAAGMRPKYRFLLSDYMLYKGEERMEYNGEQLRIIDTYQGTGTTLELTVEGLV